MIKRAGVIFNEKTKRFSIDWRTTHSYIVGTLQLDAVLEASKYAKGKLLDVGCGNKPFLHIFKDKIKKHIGIDMPSTRHVNDEIDVFASGMAIPFKNESFEGPILFDVL